MIRSLPHPNYQHASRDAVDARFAEIGFTLPFSYDLVADVAHRASWEMYGEQAQWPALDPEAEDYAYHANVQAFVQALDLAVFSGDTPLAKSAAVIAALSAQEGGQGEEGDGEPLPIFCEGGSGDEAAIKIQDDIKAVVQPARREVSPVNLGPCPEMALHSVTQEQRKVLENIALIGSRGAIRARRTSPETKPRQMQEYSEVGAINSVSAMLLPTFGYKLATKQHIVRQPKQAAKQALIVLLDVSSSMDNVEKQRWVKALLYDRLEAVAQGKAVLYILPFEADIMASRCTAITTKAEAKKYMATQYPVFNCGATDIERALKSTVACIRAGEIGEISLAGENPQIVIMNDGQDSVTPFRCEVETHAFILGQDNEGLQQLIALSGGHYERFL